MSEDEYVYRIKVDDRGVEEGANKSEQHIARMAQRSIRLFGNITREIRWAMSVLEDFGVKIDKNLEKAMSTISVTTTGISRGITIVNQLEKALKAANVEANTLMGALGVIGATAAHVTSGVTEYQRTGDIARAGLAATTLGFVAGFVGWIGEQFGLTVGGQYQKQQRGSTSSAAGQGSQQQQQQEYEETRTEKRERQREEQREYG